MTTTRALTLAAALAALAAAGCGSSKNCNDTVPPVKQVPTACTAVVGAPLTVPINTCPKCDQGAPSCDVRPSGSGRFTLEPVAQVCDPNSSCPIPELNSCPAASTGCVLTAAMTASLQPGQSYFLDIVTENSQVTKSLNVVAAGGTADCSGMAAP